MNKIMLKATRLAGIAFVHLSLYGHASATTVFAVYTPKAIIIGSDSKIVALNGADTSYGCKIHVAGRFAWASAGLLGETRGPFDLRGIAKAALQGTVSFRKGAQRLRRFTDAEYQDFRERSIQEGVPAEMAFTDVLLAGVGADQILHISMMRFGRTAPPTDCPSAKCPEFGLLELGEHARIDDILYGPRGRVHTIWKSKGVPEAIAYLIAAQESATPKLVGGPISILGIDTSGPHWIVHGACGPP